jgi:stringent starvation protein B
MSVSALTPSPSSTRPYLIRALYEWCTDNGYTPYIAAFVDERVQVPREHVKNNEIVLNISMDATSALKLGNEFVEFKARFSGSAREIMVPIDRVIAIYARENGQGMAFPMPPEAALAKNSPEITDAAPAPQPVAATDMQVVDTASASASPEATPAAPRVMQLVPSLHEASDADDEGPTPPTQPVGGNRPSLKRIK